MMQEKRKIMTEKIEIENQLATLAIDNDQVWEPEDFKRKVK